MPSRPLVLVRPPGVRPARARTPATIGVAHVRLDLIRSSCPSQWQVGAIAYNSVDRKGRKHEPKKRIFRPTSSAAELVRFRHLRAEWEVSRAANRVDPYWGRLWLPGSQAVWQNAPDLADARAPRDGVEDFDPGPRALEPSEDIDITSWLNRPAKSSFQNGLAIALERLRGPRRPWSA